MSLSVQYKSGPYLLPATPGLTPNASFTSSYSLSSSPSLSTCPSGNTSSPEYELNGFEHPGLVEHDALGKAQSGAQQVKPRTIGRTSSRPSLRHMPSWRSVASHVSHISQVSASHVPPFSHVASGDTDLDVEQEPSFSTDGAYDDPPDYGAPSPRRVDRGREGRSIDIRHAWAQGSRSSRKTGSSGFAKALKKMSFGSLGRYADRRGSMSGRDTALPGTHMTLPLDDGPLGQLQDRHVLSPAPLSPDSSHDSADSPDLDDFFTPPTIPTSLLQCHSAMPVHPTFPRPATRRDWRQLRTLPLPSHSSQSRHSPASSPEEGSTAFDLDIFSPRLARAPILRGIVDALPVSPLELPNSRVSLMTLLGNRSFPSATPTSSPSSPISDAEERTMPSLGQVASDWAQPNIAPPTPGSNTGSPARPSSYRFPRASYPSSVSSPSIFPATSHSSTSTFTRRHSAIIRPPILPTPIPPSLLMSPRSLGTPLIPPGPTSPSRLDTIAGLPPVSLIASTVTLGRRVSDRVRRPQIAVRVGEISPTAGLGMGPMNGAGSGFRQKVTEESPSITRSDSFTKRIPTPGTFGLEGEAAKRLESEGLNPYFA